MLSFLRTFLQYHIRSGIRGWHSQRGWQRRSDVDERDSLSVIFNCEVDRAGVRGDSWGFQSQWHLLESGDNLHDTIQHHPFPSLPVAAALFTVDGTTFAAMATLLSSRESPAVEYILAGVGLLLVAMALGHCVRVVVRCPLVFVSREQTVPSTPRWVVKRRR